MATCFLLSLLITQSLGANYSCCHSTVVLQESHGWIEYKSARREGAGGEGGGALL